VMTTGETMRTMINQLTTHRQTVIKIIVLARKIETSSRLQSPLKMLK
jgi:hypoxanthine-guanine phosphoribosyltransferase